MAAATWVRPAARATSMPRWIEWIQAAQLYGTTMPVVPRIDRPPTIPSRPFRVFARQLLAAGNGDGDGDVGASPVAAAISATASRIIWRGTGLIAGSPGGTAGPAGSRCRPRSPAWNVTPLPGRPGRTVARDQAAMRHVRIVAGVLDHGRHRGAGVQPLLGQREAGRAAARQADRHRVGEAQAEPTRRRPPWRPRWRRHRWSSRGAAGARPHPPSSLQDCPGAVGRIERGDA